jgi:hypothetical protein
MALTIFEAAKLSRNPLARGVMLAVATSDELISQLPMIPTPGESFVYNREKALPSAEFVAPDHASVAESGATFDRVTVPLRLIVTDVDTYVFAEEQQSETNPQSATQLTLKLKSVGRKIADKAISGAYGTGYTLSAQPAGWVGPGIDALVAGPGQDTTRHGPGSIKYTNAGTLWQYRAPGDAAYGATVAAAADGAYVLPSSNPSRYVVVTLDVSDATADGVYELNLTSSTNEPDGLNKLIPTAQTIASTGAAGDALSLALMDRMIDEMVKVRNRLVFIMNAKLKAKFYALVRSLGGVGIETTTLPGVNGAVPAYRGIPILQNDWIVSTEVKGAGNTLTSLYLVDLSEEGFHCRVGQGGSSLDVQADPRNARIMGLRVRDIGELEAKEARRTRVSWYGAFALGSELAACRAKELITA